MQDFTTRHNYFFITLSLVGVLLLVLVLTPYLETEYYSNTQAQIFEKLNTCDKSKDSDLKFIKVVSFNRAYRTASVYCIYQNSELNTQYNLENQNENNGWHVVYSYKLNKKSNFYWPFYI